jgi:hypothetical protein
MISCWQAEDSLDFANCRWIACVLSQGDVYQHANELSLATHFRKVVADLHAGCVIHRSDLNNHIQRFALIFSATRTRAEVVCEVRPDTERC